MVGSYKVDAVLLHKRLEDLIEKAEALLKDPAIQEDADLADIRQRLLATKAKAEILRERTAKLT